MRHCPELPPPYGLLVKLEQEECFCGCDISRIAPGDGVHVARLLCVECDQLVGWLPKPKFRFIEYLCRATAQLGPVRQPIILRGELGDDHVSEKKYDDTNRGALFRNNDKQSDQSPDYRGRLNVNGVDYWLSGWLQESKEGMKYFSLSVKPQKPEQKKPTQSLKDEMEDEIPF